MTHHYSRKDLVAALQDIGLKKGDTVFSHSNVGFLGLPDTGRNAQHVFNAIVDAFLEVLGDQGTLIVPTFTYSFSQNKIFDLDNTPSDCGMFTEMLRQSKNAYRSEDPNISVAAIGAKAKEMTANAPENSYGCDSFFDRFYKTKGVICNINFDAGSTFVHYVERVLQVPYRFDKSFTGIFQKNNRQEKRKSTIWVRQLADGTSASFEPFSKLALERDLYKMAKVGRGFVGAISAEQTFNLIKETLPTRPWLLTEAEVLGIKPAINNE